MLRTLEMGIKVFPCFIFLTKYVLVLLIYHTFLLHADQEALIQVSFSEEV